MVHLERRSGDFLRASLEIYKVFGNKKIRHGSGDLKGSGQTDGGAVVVMRRNSDIIGFVHLGNFLEFEYPATVTDVGIDDVCRLLFEDGAKFGFGIELFARHNG